MKKFTRMAAQGDFIILRINEIPENLELVAPENGVYTVAHSETGHNHIMVADRVGAFKGKGASTVNLYELFLKVEALTEITHLREFDTHEALGVEPGIYKIMRQREYTPEGYRKAQD